MATIAVTRDVRAWLIRRSASLMLVVTTAGMTVDGTLAAGVAVLDESALTGEALPVQHVQGDTLRSGTVNAAGPFDLRASASAADSTYSSGLP